MQFSVIQSKVRERLLEPSARFFTDAQIKAFINDGYADFIGRTKWAERLSCQPAVANQYEYNLPSNTIKVKKIRWEDQYRINPKKEFEFDNIVGQANDSTNSRPHIYTLLPWDLKIRVYPIPSAASPETTMNDSGGISSSDTTVTVTSTTDFPTTGRLIIESEQILYTGKTSTTFTGLVRGDGRTTAASHADGLAVKLGSIQVYNTYMPADMSADTDLPAFNPEYHEALVWYAVNIGQYKRQRFKEGAEAFNQYMDFVKRAERDRLQESLEGHEHVLECDYEVDDWYY